MLDIRFIRLDSQWIIFNFSYKNENKISIYKFDKYWNTSNLDTICIKEFGPIVNTISHSFFLPLTNFINNYLFLLTILIDMYNLRIKK